MDLKAFTYSFPFWKPFQTSANTFATRKGIIIELQKKNITALGEAAPLPGFSKESMQEVLTQLKRHAPDIKNIFTESLSLQSLQIFYRKNKILPSLQFALDTLAVDYISQKTDVAAQDFLFDEPAQTLKVNGTISIQDLDETLESVHKLTDNGFSTIKMKVGVNFENEHTVIEKIRAAFPELTIRLDANKAWNLKEASKNLSKLGKLEIEYCEEPLMDPSIENLKKLRASVATPIALDESLLASENMESLAPFISVMVIKPMVFGNLSKLFATKRLADHHDNKVIYTTSLESGIGRIMTATLATGLGDRDSAHGLATGGLLKMDVWYDGTYINNGSISLPDRSELGKRYDSNHKYLESGQIDL